jgi:hypothetical protein
VNTTVSLRFAEALGRPLAPVGNSPSHKASLDVKAIPSAYENLDALLKLADEWFLEMLGESLLQETADGQAVLSWAASSAAVELKALIRDALYLAHAAEDGTVSPEGVAHDATRLAINLTKVWATAAAAHSIQHAVRTGTSRYVIESMPQGESA